MTYDTLIPVGLRAGAAATAIRDLKPTSIVFLASTTSAKNIKKIFEVAGIEVPYKIVTVYNSEEYTKVIDRLLKEGVPDKVVLTGGTTMMQASVSRIAEIFGSKRFVVLDMRPLTREKKEKNSWDISGSGITELKDNIIDCEYVIYDNPKTISEIQNEMMNSLVSDGIKDGDIILLKILKGGLKDGRD